MKIKNPILTGFHPDPSIVRVGPDYYLAVSTFEWFPGVQLFHSTDLVNWDLIGHPLSRISQLDMKGVPDSCGVWAPCLSYDQGLFYLVYSNVKSFDGVWKDTPNFLVTSPDPEGPWSEPIFLSAAGFDGSLFHDPNGKKWYLSMLVDHRDNKLFGGIIMQEYDPEGKELIGDPIKIFDGTELGITEGPHLYFRDDYYYLLTAEGGTEYGHAVTLARSRQIEGPYEVHPHNPVLSARDHPECYLQKTGHADLVESDSGNWYMVFLTGRPLSRLGRCTLGRETAIIPFEWETNQWPNLPFRQAPKEVEIPEALFQNEDHSFLMEFVSESIDPRMQSLRIPITEEWATTKERRNYLRIYGQESLSSFHQQSMLACRVRDFHCKASTYLEFEPEGFQQMAGLVCYYNTSHFHYLNLTRTDSRLNLNVITCNKGVFSEPWKEEINEVKEGIWLQTEINRNIIQFTYAINEDEWKKAGPKLDASILSDDYVRDESNRYRPAFTGTFIGLCCQDLTGMKIHADFKWFNYKSIQK